VEEGKAQPMFKRFVSLLAIVTAAIPFASAQTKQISIIRDAKAIMLLEQSLKSMTGTTNVSDVKLLGTATRTIGPDQQSGEATLEAKGTAESRVALSLSGFSRTEVRNIADGASVGSYVGDDSAVHSEALHNCFTDASWFFPPLSSLSAALNNTDANVSYIGQETLQDVSVDHIRTWLSVSSPDAAAVKLIAHLSAVDWFFDSSSHLPIAARFTTHPAENASADMNVEIRYSNYQSSQGALVPFHVEKYLNGSLRLDLVVSSALLNSGLPDSDFSLQ
jgi:hypothetical protein